MRKKTDSKTGMFITSHSHKKTHVGKTKEELVKKLDREARENSFIGKLVKALKKDKAYRYAWVANIAMQFQDEYQRKAPFLYGRHSRKTIHEISNKAAENFLELLCRE